MIINEKNVASYITKSKLPDADYVINPYVGCPHKCIYCYAEFMKRFTNHPNEEWGDFLDIKRSEFKFDLKKYENSSILFGSVTDAYNPYEKKYEISRNILKCFLESNAKIDILTKSKLVLRDLDIITKIKNIRIGISLNTLDDQFRKIIEPYASSIENRIDVLKQLKKNNISNYLFMSPIFPGITEFKQIIEKTKEFVDLYCFENLNLRATYKPRVLKLIKEMYPDQVNLYDDIYNKKNASYWYELEQEIINYCEENKIKYKIYFYHEKIRKE